ncbi:RNase adapter RapZ [Pseudomethylobacillus aquaticus]|uniref:RNase adapter RapZ n=1 Tax=Pseudomethylobacillus aquaticus TaxID=2676064 RepID=A0A3N0UZ35_9PROT|nr:RNase adapter RapZ [Pseudomethylobacillus aquaticus]ROH85826.1 RNase adapter RapZ [Pseudomethylobacillus aquaticus]
MQLVIISGLSGSGKSVALRALEDSGYYCIDNLPATLLPQITSHIGQQQRLAVSVDTRSAALEALYDNIAHLRAQGVAVQLLYLESNVETLVKRFSETRRRHPLSNEHTTLAESIVRERHMLEQLAEHSHRLDTSDISANTLRSWVRSFVSHDHSGLTLLFASFGFKHGIPLDADYVFDVRCLPNPYYDPALRPLTGRDLPVAEFLQQHAAVDRMYEDIQQFISRWLPSFVHDHRSYLTVAVGCTGGQHRSVYLVEKLAAHFQQQQQKVLVRHRQLGEVHDSMYRTNK